MGAARQLAAVLDVVDQLIPFMLQLIQPLLDDVTDTYDSRQLPVFDHR